MAERSSWLAVEPGWDVLGRSGERLGEVAGVVGDPDADIFDGLRVRDPDGRVLYVPAERVGEIVEGRLSVDAAAGELEESPAEDEPGGSELRRDRDAEL